MLTGPHDEGGRVQADAEPVRLVIWDLDDTFWSGTLSEGGITYRRDAHDVVRTLASRGIVSAICSKNDHDAVRDILVREGIWDSFVFPSINWESKGPRLAALIEAVQLRPTTILFIDDNAGNRAEAAHFVPGLQIADETIIPTLLDNPLFRGKQDSELTRLAQYKLLERRQQDARAATPPGGDNTQFLRASHIALSIEHDLTPHIDRAIELINRTNQLNFIKARMPEDIDAARRELRALLSDYRLQAGIIRVRDDYGDYGHCGLYIVRMGVRPKLLQFCFSCRILNMGVETWLYQHLGRPNLRIEDKALRYVIDPSRHIDWIRLEQPDHAAEPTRGVQTLDYVYARGGCDLLAITHYFNMAAREIHRDLSVLRAGANMRRDHTMFARYALEGIADEARVAFAQLGYTDEDYTSPITDLPKTGRGVWLLSFWTDADFSLYRHRATGQSAPLCIANVQTGSRNAASFDMTLPEYTQAASILDTIRRNYAFTGMIAEAEFKKNLRLILGQAQQDVSVFILMANEHVRRRGETTLSPRKRALNDWVRDIARHYSQVSLVDIESFIEGEQEVITTNHFDRMVYFRVFKHIMDTMQHEIVPEVAEPPVDY